MSITAYLKSIIFILYIIIFCHNCYSQNDGDYRTRTGANGNWTDNLIWQVYQSGTGWTNTNVYPDYTKGTIEIRNDASIIFNESLTIDQLIINGTLSVNSGIILSTNNGPDDEIVLNGTLIHQGLVGDPMNGKGTINENGTYIHNTSSSAARMVDFFPIKHVNSNWIYRGGSGITPAVSLAGKTFGNLIFESTSGVWEREFTGTTSLIVNGNFLLGSNVTILYTNTGISTFKGNYTRNGNIIYNAGTQTHKFTGTNEQVISGSGNIEFENLIIDNSANVKLEKTVSILSGFTSTVYGILNCGNYLITGAGNFNLTSGASLKIGSAQGINTSGATGNIQVTGTRIFSTQANYEYNGSSAQVTGNALDDCNNLIINNVSGITMSGAVNVNGNLILTNGLLLVTDKTLTVNGDITESKGISNMIILDDGINTGTLIKLVSQTNLDYIFPIGDTRNITQYSPVTIMFNTGTTFNNSYVTVNVINDKLSGNTSITDYLNRYWILSSEGISNLNYDIILQYNAGVPNNGDVVGTETNIYFGKLDGSSWTGLGKVNNIAHQLIGTTLESFSTFTGGEESVMPVELLIFTTNVLNNTVNLYWTTSNEINNYGFEIERKENTLQTSEWLNAGFVKGSGTTNETKNYSFVDRNLQSGKYKYRLKQIDYNGNFQYFELNGLVEIGTPQKYYLSQNYPNPFNPVTKIDYELPYDGKVVLKIYDITGREISTLVNDYKQAGYNSVEFNASNLASGVYFYSLNTEKFTKVMKMVLIK